MSFLLDTDTCSAHLKQRGSVTNRFLQYTGQLYVSVITIGELRTWATRAGAPAGRGRGVDAMLADVTVLTVTVAEANKFGELRAGLLEKAQAGTLTRAEKSRAENYERIGHFLSTLKSQARTSLKRKSAAAISPRQA